MIPQSSYISIASNVLNSVIGERDFSGLVFSKVAMKTGAPKKTDYETNQKVVSLTKDEVAANFDDTDLLAFAERYFAYNGGTKRPYVLNFAYVGTNEKPLAAYNRVIADFANFGAFTFYGTFPITESSEGEADGLDLVGSANNGNDYGWVFIVQTTKAAQSSAAAAFPTQVLTHLTHDACAPLSWYASCDYDKAGASGTIDYKQFPSAVATIDSATDKATADGLKVNYIGLVQNYGNGLKFYQTGINMDGTDLGVVRDMCWMNAEIINGYFNLQNSIQKIPANHVGCAMVRNIVVGVAVRAINNGSILIDKILDSDQVSIINQYANDDTAADTVQSAGYYINTEIVKVGNQYKCQYTLVYAKGDHIAKVEGLHVLV